MIAASTPSEAPVVRRSTCRHPKTSHEGWVGNVTIGLTSFGRVPAHTSASTLASIRGHILCDAPHGGFDEEI